VGSFAVVVDVKTRKNPATTGNYKPPGALGWGYLHPPVIMQQAASTGSAGLTPGGTDAASKTAYDPFAPWYTSDKNGSTTGTTAGYGTITDYAAKLNAYCTPGFSTEALAGSENGFKGCCQDVIT
jgi:hypothetical protein